MLKKTITYTDFNDQEVTEDHYFHLSKAELVELQMGQQGGLDEYLQRIVQADDGAAIMREFKRILLLSYGKRSEDGARFIKNDELTKDFVNSEAYSTLFMELVTDAGAASEFVNSVVPRELRRDVDEMQTGAMGKPRTPAEAARKSEELGQPASPIENVFDNAEPKILSEAEIREMDSDELKSGLATGRYKLQ